MKGVLRERVSRFWGGGGAHGARGSIEGTRVIYGWVGGWAAGGAWHAQQGRKPLLPSLIPEPCLSRRGARGMLGLVTTRFARRCTWSRPSSLAEDGQRLPGPGTVAGSKTRVPEPEPAKTPVPKVYRNRPTRSIFCLTHTRKETLFETVQSSPHGFKVDQYVVTSFWANG